MAEPLRANHHMMTVTILVAVTLVVVVLILISVLHLNRKASLDASSGRAGGYDEAKAARCRKEFRGELNTLGDCIVMGRIHPMGSVAFDEKRAARCRKEFRGELNSRGDCIVMNRLQPMSAVDPAKCPRGTAYNTRLDECVLEGAVPGINDGLLDGLRAMDSEHLTLASPTTKAGLVARENIKGVPIGINTRDE